MNSEKKLVRLCKKHNSKAQKEVYEVYAPLMLGVCIRYAGTKAEAEDVLQESFTKIFINIHQYSGEGSFREWIRRTVINTSITHYHRNLKYRNNWSIEDVTETVEDYDSEYTMEEMMNVINDLSPGFKMVFNLYAIEGYKHREIAEIMNIDENTSKSQYSRARKVIQAKLVKLKNNNRRER